MQLHHHKRQPQQQRHTIVDDGGAGVGVGGSQNPNNSRRGSRKTRRLPIFWIRIGLILSVWACVPIYIIRLQLHSHTPREITVLEDKKKDSTGLEGLEKKKQQLQGRRQRQQRQDTILLKKVATRKAITTETKAPIKAASSSIPQVAAATTSSVVGASKSSLDQQQQSKHQRQQKHKKQQQRQERILIWTNMIGYNRVEPCDTNIKCVYTTHAYQLSQADASVYQMTGYSIPNRDDKHRIYLQMEGEHYYPIELYPPDKYRHRKNYQNFTYDIENTYRWNSSPILKPYFEFLHYNVQKGTDLQHSYPSIPFHDDTTVIDGVSFVAHNCHSKNQREQLIEEMREFGLQVDGLSRCLNNVNQTQLRETIRNSTLLPYNLTKPHDYRFHEKITMMRMYKFHAAFENGNIVDYVTEKVYQALIAGVIPIYFGAPNIRDYVPDNSIINVHDFQNNTQALVEHIKQVMTNETLYNSYHEWRNNDVELPTWFLKKFNFTRVSTECRTCRYIYSLKHNLPWDKVNQKPIYIYNDE